MEHYLNDLEDFKELYTRNYPKWINTDYGKILSKYKKRSYLDFFNKNGNIHKTSTVKGTRKNLTDKEKEDLMTVYKYKKPVDDKFKEIIKYNEAFKDVVKDGNRSKDYDDLIDDLNEEINIYKQRDKDEIKEEIKEELKEDTEQIKQQQSQTHKAGSEAVERQNKINDVLKQALQKQGLTIDQMQEIINETNKRMEADKAERQAEKVRFKELEARNAEDKKRSKAFKELVKEMSQQDDITTTDKGELIKRLLKNHSDIIHDEETAKAAADAIFRNALNKKVVSKKQRQYLYNFYKAYPQFVEQLPEEQQEAINTEIMDKYNEQQKNKILHYMLPKERPRWEKATTQHNLNPMLGRRSYG